MRCWGVVEGAVVIPILLTIFYKEIVSFTKRNLFF